MPRNTLLLAILASSVIFLIGAAPSTASAANCNFVNSVTYFAGVDWHFNSQAQSCTDVDQVQTRRIVSTVCSGWRDLTKLVDHCAPYGINLEEQLYGRIGIPLTNSAVATWNIHPWCAGNYPPGGTFYAYTSSLWRIHRLATNTWGGWISAYNYHNIGC